MMKLRIKDNSVFQKSKFDCISTLTGKISDKTLLQLQNDGLFVFPEAIRDADDITNEQMLIESFNNDYRSGNVMGFIGCGKERLTIESRFSRDGKDYFFQYLLEKVLKFPSVLELNTDAKRQEKLFSLLLFLFPRYLKSAMRKGLFKTYINNRYNDSNVKGSIDVAGHIRKNIPFTGKIAYNMREFSYDNHLMQLVRHTIEFIKTKEYGHKLLSNNKDEVEIITNSTGSYKYSHRRKILIENTKKIIRHAYYYEYRELQRLCIMILQYENHNLGSGASEIYGVLFDGAWLWEEYVNMLVGGAFYHPLNKTGKGGERLFSCDTGKIGLIYPDFISKSTNDRIIAEAKYKPYGNIANKDYLQVLAYMFRFDAKIGLYFYPEVDETQNVKLRLNEGTEYEKNVSARDDIYVTKCGLLIPGDARDYEDFKEKIEKSEREFKQQIDQVTS